MDQAQAAGSSLSLWWDGHEYKFAELTDGVKGDFVAWLKSGAHAAPYDMQRDMVKPDGTVDLQRFADAKALIVENVTTKQYDWGGRLCSAALGTLPGQAKLLHLAHAASDRPEADLAEIEGLITAKNNEAVKAGIPVELSEIATFLDRLQEESFPKSRAAFLARRAAARKTPA